MTVDARLLLLGTLDSEGMNRILQCAVTDGYDVQAALPVHLRVQGAGSKMRLWKLGEPLNPPDVVIHKNLPATDPVHAVLSAWERDGVLVLNPPHTSPALGNKWLQQDQFERAGVPQPHTELAQHPSHLHEFAREHGYPFVVKPLSGSSTHGVYPVVGYGDLRTRIEPLLDGTAAYVMQRFVRFKGRAPRTQDRKAVVVDGRIVSVMQRTGAQGEVAASRFGDEDEVPLGTLQPQEARYVLAAATAIGVVWCSVDYWLTDDHPAGILVNEVNGFPGLPPREAGRFGRAVLTAVGARLAQPPAPHKPGSENTGGLPDSPVRANTAQNTP